MPHPYPNCAAAAWIAAHEERYVAGSAVRFAITRDTELIGSAGLNVSRRHKRGELDYWVGVSHQGAGYATQAARSVVDFAFRRLDLNRVHAQHLSSNAASGRVLARIGNEHEGTQRQHVVRWEDPQDWELWGILRSEWEARR